MEHRNIIPRKLLSLYQQTLSPKSDVLRALYSSPLLSLTPGVRPGCRFWPSCSVYADEALKEYPLHTAAALISRRLIRCRFGSCGGIDTLTNQ